MLRGIPKESATVTKIASYRPTSTLQMGMLIFYLVISSYDVTSLVATRWFQRRSSSSDSIYVATCSYPKTCY